MKAPHSSLFSSITENPLDILEALFHSNGWSYNRSNEKDIGVDISGGWCEYHMSFSWHTDMHALLFHCSFDMRIPKTKFKSIPELLILINRRVWMGHFDLCEERQAPYYRHTLPTRGIGSYSAEMMEDIMDISLAECERFYPVFQYHIWGDHSPDKAIEASLLNCKGEA